MHGQADDVARQFRTLKQAAARPMPATAPARDDVLDQIRKLGELRDAGVLSDEEFETKKSSLLERL
jgi:hypothetical protein